MSLTPCWMVGLRPGNDCGVGHADHDMIYLEPFAGHAEIRAYFDKVVSIVPQDLKFVVEDITDGDPCKVGVKWCAGIGCQRCTLSSGRSWQEQVA